MANRYWVGGSATWDSTAGSKWATTSGGVGGAAVPTAADDVFFDAASGAVTVTTSGTTTDVARSINFTGFTGTFAHAAGTTITIGDASGGALTLVSGMTYSRGNATTSAWSFISTSNNGGSGWTITWAGKVTGGVTFNGAGGKWVLADAMSLGGVVTFSAGTLDTNGKSVSAGSWVTTGTGTRTLTLGASSITLTGGGTAFQLVSTNLTMTANTATLTLTGGSITFSITSGFDFNGTSIVASGAGPFAPNASFTCANFTRTGTAAKTDTLQLTGNLTVTGTLTLNGNSATNRLHIRSNIFGTRRTITAATVSVSNLDFEDIVGAGAGSWNLASITGGSGDCGNNSGITFTTPVNRYAVVAGNWSSTATWSTSSGGSGGASVPLVQDTAFLDASSAAGTYTVDMPRVGSIDCTGFTRTLALNSVSFRLYGSLTLSSGLTLNGNAGLTVTLASRGSATMTTAGKSIGNLVAVAAVTGAYTLQDAATFSASDTAAVSVSSGTLDTNSQAVTFSGGSGGLSVTGGTLTAGTTTFTFSGTNGAGGWSVTGGTVNASSATIAYTGTFTGTKTFAGGGKTYGTFSWTGSSTAIVAITGANTFGTITVSGGARTLTLPSSTTTTITTAFNVNGTAGNLVTLNSSTSGTAATLSKASGTVSVDYLSIQDSTATGGAAWYAGAHSTSVSGNTGWIFTAPPVDAGKFEVKTSGSFGFKPTLVKISGTFTEKPAKVKLSGTFVDT